MRVHPAPAGAPCRGAVCYSGPGMVEEQVALPTAWGCLAGTLVLPDRPGPWPAVLVVAGSGPTDRDGNNPLLPAPIDNLKRLAHRLAAHGMASLRYDKRGVGASECPGLSELTLRFDDLVEDARLLGEHLRADPRVAALVLLGHSEGALVATLAAPALTVRGLACVAGAGEPAADIMRRQIAAHMPADLAGPALAALEALQAQRPVDDVPEALALLFRPSVQPYLMSWFRHDPAALLGALSVPVLLVQGSADVQVNVADVQRLGGARPDARMRVMEGMDHLLALDGDLDAGTERVAAEVADWLRSL